MSCEIIWYHAKSNDIIYFNIMNPQYIVKIVKKFDLNFLLFSKNQTEELNCREKMLLVLRSERTTKTTGF